MNNTEPTYAFWFWTKKFNAVLLMITHLADHKLKTGEKDLILLGLAGTNDEKNIWLDHSIDGASYKIDLKLAHDAEEGFDMIHIKIYTSGELKEKLYHFDLLQAGLT